MTPSDPVRPPLCFTLCPAFHGATLLSLLVNNHSELICLGDTNPTRSYDQVCACGHRVSECSFWQAVFHGARVERFASDDCWLPTLPHFTGSREVDRWLCAGLSLGARLPPLNRPVQGIKASREYLDAYHGCFRVAFAQSGAKYFVDGQKSVLKALWFARSGLFDVRFVHLTRDPRGFAASAARAESASAETAALAWRRTHRRITWLCRQFPADRTFRMRYEDLVASPQETMGSLFDFLKVGREDVICAPRDPKKHHAMGNKMIFEFDGTLRLDRRWESELSADDQELVTRTAEPLLRRLGYGAQLVA
jgi:hypothetical protein